VWQILHKAKPNAIFVTRLSPSAVYKLNIKRGVGISVTKTTSKEISNHAPSTTGLLLLIC